MRITVTLQNEARLVVNLDDDKAKVAFSNITAHLANLLKQEEVQPKRIFNQPVIKPTNIHTEKQETEESVFKKLLIIRHPKCGNVIATKIAQDQESVYCRFCEDEVELKGLKQAKYICPNCSTRGFFLTDGSMKTVKCKNCQSEIDLLFHEKKDVYMSANMFDKEEE